MCTQQTPPAKTTDSLDSQLASIEDDGISAFWRKNISTLESTELANVLRALRKVAGHLGENVGRIEWMGMSCDGEGDIVLDPEIVLGRYPVPYGKFDYLVGMVTHEAFHRTEWSDLVWKKTEPDSEGLKIIHKVIFQKMVYTGEDIYVDYISDQSILGLYTRVARAVAMEGASLRVRPGKVTVDELLYLWWGSAWRGIEDKKCHEEYQQPLRILQGVSEELKMISRREKTVTYRCEERHRLYIKAWEDLKDVIGSWQVVDKMLLWYPTSTCEENKTPAKTARKSFLSSKIALDIETQLAYDSKDITSIIRSVVGEEVEVVPTSRWDFNIPSHPVVDHQLVARLKAIFQSYADRKIMISRGLKSGKVDKRRLYRAPITARCFYDKQGIAFMDWNICLLIDASGSMRGSKWRMVENTVGTIHKAFRGFQNRLQAYGYFETDGICMISSLIKGRKLLSIPAHGQTASGQAIIAAAYFMPHEGRRSFIIHITDGETNFGCDVQHGIDYCREKNIHLVTLGCGYKDKDTMLKQYGKTIQFIDHFGQLPHAIELLLKWTLIYGKRHSSGLDNYKNQKSG
jgi:hypothetical protein